MDGHYEVKNFNIFINFERFRAIPGQSIVVFHNFLHECYMCEDWPSILQFMQSMHTG